jgi:hypothetical protein
VSEALAAATDEATVSARVEGGTLLVEIRGQGIHAGGTRIEALGGTLDLDDALVRASIPVA